MALRHTLKSPAAKAAPATKTADPAKAAPPPPALHFTSRPAVSAEAPPVFLRVDAVEVLEAFAAELDAAANRAERAVGEGRPRDAVLAAGDMQSLLRAWKDRLADALAQTRSKRIPPAVRQAARNTAERVLPAMAAHMRTMEAQLRVHRARQEAIGSALRAASTTPVGVYGASLRHGVRLVTRTATGRTLGVTV